MDREAFKAASMEERMTVAAALLAEPETLELLLPGMQQFDGQWPCKEMLAAVQEAVDQSPVSALQGSCLLPVRFTSDRGMWVISWHRQGAKEPVRIPLAKLGNKFDYAAWEKGTRMAIKDFQHGNECIRGVAESGEIPDDDDDDDDGIEVTAVSVPIEGLLCGSGSSPQAALRNALSQLEQKINRAMEEKNAARDQSKSAGEDCDGTAEPATTTAEPGVTPDGSGAVRPGDTGSDAVQHPDAVQPVPGDLADPANDTA